jgi:hypothetical protein
MFDLRLALASGYRRLPKPCIDAVMQATQGECIMEKQPNSRMCFVCGIENPVGPHGAPSGCTWPSIPTRRGAACCAPTHRSNRWFPYPIQISRLRVTRPCRHRYTNELQFLVRYVSILERCADWNVNRGTWNELRDTALHAIVSPDLTTSLEYEPELTDGRMDSRTVCLIRRVGQCCESNCRIRHP